MQNNKNNKNVILAVIISFVFMIAWQYFYEIPQSKTTLNSGVNSEVKIFEKQEEKTKAKSPEFAFIPANFAVDATKNTRVEFENSKIKGSINGVGLKIDNLELKNYAKDGKNFNLLFPSEAKEAYFAQFGFVTNDEDISLPSSKTIWNLKKINENEILASFENKQGILFEVYFKLDENYMFDVYQKITNKSGSEVNISAYVRIFKTENPESEKAIISHEGFVFNIENRFMEEKYEKLTKVKKLLFSDITELFWGGFADKYWLTSFIFNNSVCVGKNCQEVSGSLSLNGIKENGIERFQIDFVTSEVRLNVNENVIFPSKFFAGAKELRLLDYYQDKGFNFNDKNYKIKNFDKNVDFGIFYFLTKPIFLLLTFLNSFLHNFGFAIILLTLIIKLILFPISTKSYISIGKMKAVSPLINEMKKEITDKMQLNRKIMELYKEKQINPLSGCLPILLQIPVFFALYKVLYISIEMRGAPFIWWITDLSMKDPTSIFNLFGLLPFTVPSFLQIGVLPILMGVTTYLQQSLSPKSNDPTQAMILKSMPFILIFVFASFPSGIVLYWVVNNILSISQQIFVEKMILPKALEKGGLRTKSKR